MTSAIIWLVDGLVQVEQRHSLGRRRQVLQRSAGRSHAEELLLQRRQGPGQLLGPPDPWSARPRSCRFLAPAGFHALEKFTDFRPFQGLFSGASSSGRRANHADSWSFGVDRRCVFFRASFDFHKPLCCVRQSNWQTSFMRFATTLFAGTSPFEAAERLSGRSRLGGGPFARLELLVRSPPTRCSHGSCRRSSPRFRPVSRPNLAPWRARPAFSKGRFFRSVLGLVRGRQAGPVGEGKSWPWRAALLLRAVFQRPAPV